MLQIHVIHVQRNALHIHCTSNGSTYTHIIHYEFTISYVRITYTSCPSSFMYTAYYRCYTFIFYILIHVHIYTVCVPNSVEFLGVLVGLIFLMTFEPFY